MKQIVQAKYDNTNKELEICYNCKDITTGLNNIYV